ncbi:MULTISPECIES: ATP-binding cassette domain-containing protein [Caproicibacterium]|uniref:ATP-binding cassette domain-containing protein n=1 Tax=Caproicibacterium argilliputei TaxID=3030016 RepID=A0AA97H378_9FIRM|nr:ATP-binding cassette domain-containing protein [Caproicibacterium argilliputei]WOC31983.1 ATP-binding cassette domain-containing protein [Caproicibacterium argilliputei]
MGYCVEIEDLTKQLKHRTVLNHISLTLEAGGVYGLYGHNGSGKTMLLRSIAGLIYPTSGTVKIDGKQLGKDLSFPEKMGLIIENVGFGPEYTGFENLKTLAMIRAQVRDEQIKEAISRVGLDPADKRTYKKYSLGMKQRLAVAQASWSARSFCCWMSRQTPWMTRAWNESERWFVRKMNGAQLW